MIPFRLRFAFKRIFDSNYRNSIRSVVSSPSEFYYILLRKLSPWSSQKILMLHLKDGSAIPVEEFWTLFVFDEIMVDRCYECVEVVSGGPYDAVIDVGANVGLFALRSRQLWPKASILAIEPHPGNFRRLETLVALNKLQNIRPMRIGVGEKCGSANLYLDPRNIAGHSMYKGAETAHTVMPIEIRPLADLIGEIDPGGRVLMKIDCEGCEFPLISSLTPDVVARISCIVIEPERGIGFSLNQMLDKLRFLGFSVRDDGHFVTATR